MRQTKRFFREPGFRSAVFTQLFQAKHVHQTTPLTAMDRYPIIFNACRDYFEGKENLKILSYGCSTGEEVVTLRNYFPNATIIGAEINKRSLAACKKRQTDEKISFVYSRIDEIRKHGPFDAIFCMAVLQRKPHHMAETGISSLKKIYPFEKFEHTIMELDDLLQPNGLMVVHFTQYDLLDTAVASKYEAFGPYTQHDYKSPVFDKNSEVRRNPAPQKIIFKKTSK